MRFEVGLVVIFVAMEGWVVESGGDENEAANEIMVERDKTEAEVVLFGGDVIWGVFMVMLLRKRKGLEVMKMMNSSLPLYFCFLFFLTFEGVSFVRERREVR